jgi:general secretion pathway protein G
MHRILGGRFGHETHPRSGARGFTIIELLSVMVIMGVLAGLALPKLFSVINQARVAKAIGDIKAIQTDLMSIEAGGQALPASLAAIGRGGMLDPWGNPYIYNPFPPGPPPGGARTDRFGVPTNSSFDLYSMGVDGGTAAPLPSGTGQDDIVRAGDGGYVGLGRNY